jgi:hypothetical protein
LAGAGGGGRTRYHLSHMETPLSPPSWIPRSPPEASPFLAAALLAGLLSGCRMGAVRETMSWLGWGGAVDSIASAVAARLPGAVRVLPGVTIGGFG